MIRSRKARSGIVGVAVFVAALAVGILGATITLGTSPDRQIAPGGPNATATTEWSTNTQGLTYGSGALATSPQDEPDLIRAEASNGKVGYVLRTDLEGETPSSPQEALSQQTALAGKERSIPVYESDGTTQIGLFAISGSAGAVSVPSN